MNTIEANHWLQLRAMLGLIFALFALGAHAAPSQPEAQNYRLSSGDVIEIRVYGEDDLTVNVRLGDSGTINYPFLGELKVDNLTVAELEKRIAEGLNGRYLVDPIVSVAITEYRPFFVNGEVQRPGAIAYQPGVTLRKAIAMAGGFTERANRKSADVIRGGERTGQASAIDMDDQVHPGDIITVKQSFF